MIVEKCSDHRTSLRHFVQEVLQNEQLTFKLVLRHRLCHAFDVAPQFCCAPGEGIGQLLELIEIYDWGRSGF